MDKSKFDLTTLFGIAAIVCALVLRGGGTEIKLPDWVHIPSISVPSVNPDLDIPAPNSASKDIVVANKITQLVKAGKNPKKDGILLGQFYYRLATITLANENFVKTTGDVKKANEECGKALVALSIKVGDYPDLATAIDKSVADAIGLQSVPLTPESRAKAVAIFQAIGWACQEGAK